MSFFTVITDPDEVAHWSAVRRKLIKPLDMPEDPTYSTSPFANPDWTVVLVANKFRGYADINDETGRLSGGWPRRDGIRDIKSYCDPFIWCLEARGCSEFIVSTEWENIRFAEDQDPPVLYARCAANVSAINHLGFFFEEESRKIKSLNHYDLPSLTAFDDTQEWMVVDAQEEAHVIGGTNEFIKQYYEAAGGEEYVRAWYYHSEIGHLKEIDHKVLYDMAGWPHPVYPDGKHIFGDDIDWEPMFGDRIKSWGPGLTYDEWRARQLAAADAGEN